jgi:tetrapyrrole methylase family protein/MazG family protein
LLSVLHILGLGRERLDKLSLKVYRVLAEADRIYVCSESHPALEDLTQEGLPWVMLPGVNEVEGKWETALEQMAERLQSAEGAESGQDGQRKVVLALPGNPLPEEKMVTRLVSILAPKFEVKTELLAEDHPLVRLMEIMRELRSGKGCPWDREQTHDTLKKYLLEEAYEVLEALDTKNMNNLCEELGDLLLQVVFHCQLAQEAGIFSMQDVLKGIADKLIRRHPHVFGLAVAESSTEVLRNWEAIKKSEKAAQQDKASEAGEFFKIPKGLPALMLAEKTQKKAAKVGFDWEDYQGPLAKIYEELAELEQEIKNERKVADELGDLLFSIVNLSRFLGVDAEEALRQGTHKFQDRFLKMLAKVEGDKLKLEELSLQQMDLYWDKVKNREKIGTFGSF